MSLDQDSHTPLHKATQGNHVNSVEILVQRNAEIDAVDSIVCCVFPSANTPTRCAA